MVTRKENTMTHHDSRACAIAAVPALVVALLLGAGAPAAASEAASDLPLATVTRIAAAMPVAQPHAAADSAAHPALVAAARRVVPPPAAAPATPAPQPIAAGPVWTDRSGTWRQAGIASWYGGRRWHGKKTASGERFDETQLTAAHASLPIGSQVRVTVVDTGASVLVTINDRPGTRKRIIDLSRAAADHLGIVSRGLAKVHLTPD
jgi:rare lipoprotein A